MRKKLNELSNTELEELFRNNQFLQSEIIDERSDNENYYVLNEIVSYFEHYNNATNRRTFSALFDENYNRSNITVKIENYADFLDDCITFDNSGLGFSDELKPLIKRLAGRAQFFIDCYFNYEDISDKNYLLLESWIKKGVNKLIQELQKMIDDIYDSVYDDDYNYSYFEDAVYNCDRFDDITTDGRNVFFEVCKA